MLLIAGTAVCPVMAKLTLPPTETLLKLAEERNVTIVKWRIIKGGFFPGNVTVEMKIGKDGKIVNETIVIPVIYRPLKKGNEIVHVGFIDDWVIDNILKAPQNKSICLMLS